MTDSDKWLSTRFLYTRDARLFAEIEVVELDPSHYKFVIHPTPLGAGESPYMRQGPLDSDHLPSAFSDVSRVYTRQLDCLRAATRLVSSIGPARFTTH
ncbi:hypothetical protein [Exiguobacterium sp. SRB7LM]|uniref:hypothetical protein n=1 Tax=Exiguobacterium sp. SRB7LM TaxID=2608401 RepID=UPI0018C37E1C|nr:hypothetical protein [Exiguobacterium sp. SRB7LM]MBG0917815.1 hypothetical protein [Exiguobacterium sp. SRB7LM]